jgi:glucose-1-phosphate thymidylyltransferase
MKINKGIILAGGFGTRLAPLTNLFNKHMVPLYNKFIIDYPINTLKSIGVENLTVVLGGAHYGQVVSYLEDGSKFGMDINYVYQNKPEGIAQAINICKNSIGNNRFCVVLGDNIFENKINFQDSEKAQIVLSTHHNLNRFGVATIYNNQIIKIEEKPKEISWENGLQNYAITGCYLFDNNFFEYFKELNPSSRGEYEITDIINMYNKDNNLSYTFVDGLWSDAGTHESVNFLNNFFYYKNRKTSL